MMLATRRISVPFLVAALAAGNAARSSARAQGTAAVPAARLADAPDHFLVVGDVRLRYREIGRGEPVVLLHGATRNLEDWLDFADSLAREHRVIAFDQRGHGQSTKFVDLAHYGAPMVDDVVRVLDRLHIQRAHLVGHSMGAVVAANVAARHPTRVMSVSLVAAPLFADSTSYMQVYRPGIADLARGAGMARFNKLVFPGIPDSVARAASVATLAANPAPTLVAVFTSVGVLALPPSTAGAVRGVPALVVAGSADPLIAQARWLASWWPDARLVEISGADHGSIMVRPELLAAVRQQLRTVTASRSSR